MSQPSKYRTLIADDEQPARDWLKKLLAEHAAQIELIGEAQNGLERQTIFFGYLFLPARLRWL